MEINYLDHTVSAKGMEPGIDGVKAIVEMAPPKTYTGIRQFLGATGYFCRFIKGYANIAKPLNDLLSGVNSKLKSYFKQLPPAAVVVFQELKLSASQCQCLPSRTSTSPSYWRQMHQGMAWVPSCRRSRKMVATILSSMPAEV